MVNIRKSPHRHHHTRCIHSNTLVLLSLRLPRLYHYRFVVFNKNTCAPYTFIRLLTRLQHNTLSVRYPHPSIHHSVTRERAHACAWARARVRVGSCTRARRRVHACTCVLSHQSLDGTTIALRSPLGGCARNRMQK